MTISQIVDSLSTIYPKKHKSIIIKRHADLIDYAITHYDSTKRFRKNLIFMLNYASYTAIIGDTYVVDMNTPFDNIPDIEDNILRNTLQDLYLEEKKLTWDIDAITTPITAVKTEINKKSTAKTTSKLVVQEDTPKEYLYLRAPQYPRMDTSKVVLDDIVGSERFYMHPSLPIIPEKQNEISCTTDVTKMTEKELLRLFPNHLIRTRAEIMYEPCGDIPMDKDLGLLLPIGKFTPQQFRENILKYPHFFQLTRILDDEEISFYKHIEINGKLYDTLEIWDSLPDSKLIPKTSEFIKEYIVRKYLLERDSGIEHNYPLRGTLEPYLTLFAPTSFYKENSIELAKACVKSRVSFLQSRNPYLERYKQVKQGLIMPNRVINCPFKQYCRATTCRTTCPNLNEYEYLMERNGMLGNENVYSFSPKALQNASDWLTAAQGKYKVVISNDTSDTASCLTYVAVCQHYKGNTFHCSVFHLNFNEYINRIQQSWSAAGTDDDLEYIQIFLEKAKVVIVSNLDYIQFKDFQAQTLLNLAHNRKLHNQSTIIVSPKFNSLVGSGPFFARLKEVFGKEMIEL